MFIPLIINPVQVKYVRTVVGWYNVYLAGEDKPFANLSPDQFFALFPQVSKKARYGCDVMDPDCAHSLSKTA
ncbi:hypothetical protein BABA_17452 [Neobacillus bataviensis LMG 21833]|uniref:Uncharacterized protein n=1 Tax=Neobacillus bataviensis LMG 21833 TaxID=1117379 RepID=K6D0R4_9BACI|nr:hypothetical protein [Neobacillus bataviensis]EKN66052.1 hypothetical protein BABA_17452 [Neobacillus bataviensis LMG 21833]